MSNYRYYIINPLSGNQYSYTPLPESSLFQKNLWQEFLPAIFRTDSPLHLDSSTQQISSVSLTIFQQFHCLYPLLYPHLEHLYRYLCLPLCQRIFHPDTAQWLPSSNTLNTILNIHDFEANFYNWMPFLTQTFFTAKQVTGCFSRDTISPGREWLISIYPNKVGNPEKHLLPNQHTSRTKPSPDNNPDKRTYSFYAGRQTLALSSLLH